MAMLGYKPSGESAEDMFGLVQVGDKLTFYDNRGINQGPGLRRLVEKGSTGDAKASMGSLEGLEGYAYAANIMGYPARAGLHLNEGVLVHAAAEKPSLIGYIAEGTGPDGMPELVIAFRGASSDEGWEATLLGAIATEGFAGSNGKVHRDFFNLINGNPDDAEEDANPMKTIMAVLAPYKDTPVDKLPRIITTGHSLGGALAIVAAVGIAHHIPGYRQDSADYASRKLQTYTFAAPRIGDDKLAEYMRDTLKYTTVQVKNESDVVPYAPPSGLQEMRSAVKSLSGTRSRAPPTAGDVAAAAAGDTYFGEGVSVDNDRLQTYKKLLDGLDSTASDEQQVEQLQQYIEEAHKQYEAGGADSAPAASDNLFQEVLYGGEVLTTLATKWWDTPALPNGVCTLDVHEPGKWSGKYRSLEVYLDYLNTGDGSPLGPAAGKSAHEAGRTYLDQDDAKVITDEELQAQATWGVRAVKATGTKLTGAGVKVAVLDTGLDKDYHNHPAFQGVNVVAKNFSTDDASATHDMYGHGTHCLGTILGRPVDGVRIGVAPGVTDVLVAKVMPDDAKGTTGMLARALVWAWEEGANIIDVNVSYDLVRKTEQLLLQNTPRREAVGRVLKMFQDNLKVLDSITAMLQDGNAVRPPPLIIAPCGNASTASSKLPVQLPASAPGVLSVAAAGRYSEGLEVAPFSNTDAKFCAPGVGVCSAAAGSTGSGAPLLQVLSGTSMAASHVAGVAALWWEQARLDGVPENEIAGMVAQKLGAFATRKEFAPGVDAAAAGRGMVQAPPE